MLSVTSIIKSKTSNGPRIDPCGMPEITFMLDEILPSIDTICVRLSKYEAIKSVADDEKLKKMFNFCIKMEWGTLSKAFAKSNRSNKTESLLSKAKLKTFVNFNRADTVLCWCLNPD